MKKGVKNPKNPNDQVVENFIVAVLDVIRYQAKEFNLHEQASHIEEFRDKALIDVWAERKKG